MNNKNNNCSFHLTEMNNQDKTKKLDSVEKDVKKLFEKAKRIDAPIKIGFGGGR